jgi:uncharacterized protein (DUF2062 family)
MPLDAMLSRFRAGIRFRGALHLDDPPWRLALSLAVGVFISFTPLYGLQTALAIGVAIALRLNRAATLAGTWLNLPWFAPMVYAGALRLGTLVVPDPTGIRGAWLAQLLSQPGSLGWRDLPALLDSMSLPLFVGTSMLGSVAGLVTYVVSFRVISRRRSTVPPPAESHSADPHIVEPHIVEPHIVEPHIVEPHSAEPHMMERERAEQPSGRRRGRRAQPADY